jgi:hypothetical protein
MKKERKKERESEGESGRRLLLGLPREEKLSNDENHFETKNFVQTKFTSFKNYERKCIMLER